jgi:hypothetical protein
VVETFSSGINELRIILTEGSFVDVWLSLKLQGRYSFHWECQAIDGTIYRHDNAPHRHWEAVATFPRHFHNGSETNVSVSYLSAVPEEALWEFLILVRTMLRAAARSSQ